MWYHLKGPWLRPQNLSMKTNFNCPFLSFTIEASNSNGLGRSAEEFQELSKIYISEVNGTVNNFFLQIAEDVQPWAVTAEGNDYFVTCYWDLKKVTVVLVLVNGL